MPADDDSVKAFQRQARATPAFSREAERALVRRIRQLSSPHDAEEAVGTLVEANLRLVVSVAKKYVGRGLPFIDLIEAGKVGLWSAGYAFTHGPNCRFSLYATWWVHEAIRNAIEESAEKPVSPIDAPPASRWVN